MDTTNIRCAIDVGQKFIDYYYGLINNAKPLSPAYVTNNDTYKQAGHVASDICVNGLVLGTPEEFEKVLEKSRTWTNCPSDRVVRYVVESFNSQVLNSDYQFAAPRELVDIHGKNDGVRMMLTLSVSGTVYYGVEKHARENTNYMVKKHFNDVFILVPNWEVIGRANMSSNKTAAGRRYIIVSHTHRAFDA